MRHHPEVQRSLHWVVRPGFQYYLHVFAEQVQHDLAVVKRHHDVLALHRLEAEALHFLR